MGVKTILIVVTLFSALLGIMLSIPLMLNPIGPNKLRELRVMNTLSKEEKWYKANRYMGNKLFIGNAIVGIAAVVLFAIQARLPLAAIFSAGPILAVIINGICLALTFRYLKSL